MFALLPQTFYNQPTLKVAQQLLGCFLCRKVNGKIVKTKITETEAYCGPKDKASHASRGMTPRNKIMFGPPGYIYVYFTYGMHYMLNIVTERENYPAAVLIRAIEPPLSLRGGVPRNSGRRRGNPVDSATSALARRDRLLFPRDCFASLAMTLKIDGPAKLTKFLQIDKSFNGLPIFTRKHGLWVETRHACPPTGRDAFLPTSKIKKSTRIGVDYAEEYKDKLWRFYIK